MKTLDRVKTCRWLLAGAVAGLLGACGGGESVTAPAAADALSGVAAVGAPIVGGTIDVVCAGGSNLATTTSSAGAWQVTMSGQTLPCAVRVSGGTINGAANSTPYHSAALSFGTLNVTPLTDLVMANMLGSTPTTWFSGLSSTARPSITQASLDAARTQVLSTLGIAGTLNGGNPLTASFTPTADNVYDNALRAFAAAMTSAGVNYASLLQTVYTANFTAPAGFNFTNAYAAIAPAGGGGGGGGACASGSTSMTFGSAGTGSPYTNGTVVCFTTSTTSLAFSGKTLTAPTQNTAVSAPYSAYIFTDGAVRYEVVFNGSALHEINVMGSGTTFYGQFAPTPSSGGLVVSVSIAGAPATSISVGNVPAPSSQADFCNNMSTNTTFTSLQSSGGGTFTITSCSFSGKVGTVNATLAITYPITTSYPYIITYTYP